ncbi:hypothetical protein [Amorphus sp. 3PC139-8]|uniref:hypothetical protein n=1 Tax=Amorphus sp. 3PC139-8 TaxID=2735676 RepID=UPI00345DBB28
MPSVVLRAALAGLALLLIVTHASASFEEWVESVSGSESSGSYSIKNPTSSAKGRYQFIDSTLQDLGMMDANKNWTGKYGVNSTADFYANHAAQDQLMRDFSAQQWGAMSSTAKSYIGKTVSGITINEGAMLHAAHLLGAGGFNKWAASGFSMDGLSASDAAAQGMSLSEFQDYLMNRMEKGSQYDISDLAGSYTPGGGSYIGGSGGGSGSSISGDIVGIIMPILPNGQEQQGGLDGQIGSLRGSF